MEKTKAPLSCPCGEEVTTETQKAPSGLSCAAWTLKQRVVHQTVSYRKSHAEQKTRLKAGLRGKRCRSPEEQDPQMKNGLAERLAREALGGRMAGV